MTVQSRAPAAWLAPMLVCALPALAASPAKLGERPDFVQGEPVVTHYDGNDNDLLTAGLGKTGLGSATAPAIADPLAPTAEELRRMAIWSNYRALVDPTPGGGYGTFYGPNVAADGTVTDGEGKIAGTETIMLTREPDRRDVPGVAVTIVVQVPDGYDPAHGCIVAAPSSGSRGVYGAIATAGEWGLKHRCAVAYTDKASGMGAHDLQNNTVNLLRGERADAAAAGRKSNFTARLTDAQRAAFIAAHPNRFAFAHAHDEANPEADWGRFVLQSIRAAFWVLNRQFPHQVTRADTHVIASSVSNGGGASLRAAEQDRDHLIDGVAVSEPNVQPVHSTAFRIQQGSGPAIGAHGRTLIDYMTLENVFEGCAAAQPTLAAAPLNKAASPERCAALKQAGLLTGTTTGAQASEAQAKLNAIGLLPEQNSVAPALWMLYVPQSISVTYANSYGRFGAADQLCGYGFGATAPAQGNKPVPLTPAAEAAIFGTGNGIPPSGGVNLINAEAPGGAAEDRASTPDQDLRGALCLRGLAAGADPVTGAMLTGAALDRAHRIATGVAAIRATGRLHGVQAVWVQGRADALLAPNFTSRAYYGLNNATEGARTARFYEVTNAQHLDALIAVPGFNETLVPLQVYFNRAMDLMDAHLRTGAALPPSQVIHTTPRGPGAPKLAASNVPPIAAIPAQSDLITFKGGVLHIPD